MTEWTEEEKKQNAEKIASLRTYKFPDFEEKELKRAEHGINDALCSIPTMDYEDAVGFRILDKLKEMLGINSTRSILERYLATELNEDDDDPFGDEEEN